MQLGHSMSTEPDWPTTASHKLKLAGVLCIAVYRYIHHRDLSKSLVSGRKYFARGREYFARDCDVLC